MTFVDEPDIVAVCRDTFNELQFPAVRLSFRGFKSSFNLRRRRLPQQKEPASASTLVSLCGAGAVGQHSHGATVPPGVWRSVSLLEILISFD